MIKSFKWLKIYIERDPNKEISILIKYTLEILISTLHIADFLFINFVLFTNKYHHSNRFHYKINNYFHLTLQNDFKTAWPKSNFYKYFNFALYKSLNLYRLLIHFSLRKHSLLIIKQVFQGNSNSKSIYVNLKLLIP